MRNLAHVLNDASSFFGFSLNDLQVVFDRQGSSLTYEIQQLFLIRVIRCITTFIVIF